MGKDLSRLFQPRSVAVIGGGAWCRQVIRQAHKMGFAGRIHLVHPRGISIDGVPAVADPDDLPDVPDAAFIGVNRTATVDTVRRLSAMGAGGAVCFASGFSEASSEDPGARDLQATLVAAAGAMPILGPNCYGFINAMDAALLWPDQHGCNRVSGGVAILTQSSNIAINLTMQLRGLPIAFIAACGNMAQTSQAEIAMALLEDPRITVIGLHVEGFGDTAGWHALALRAYEKGVPLVALKVGASDQAQRATVSHTASLAGSDAGADALMQRLGIARLHDLPSFLETLKLLHCNGPLEMPALSCISCSGGEASLAADTARGMGVHFPPLEEAQKTALSGALGPRVALSNPLDYHTYIWGDVAKMTAAWMPMAASHIGLLILVVDYPHTDAGDWSAATEAAIAVRHIAGRPVAVVATLPELMPPEVSAALMAAGVTPICGLREAMLAAESAAALQPPQPVPPLAPGTDRAAALLSEAAAKALLRDHGVDIPRHVVVADTGQFSRADDLSAPLVLKGQGLAHKSEADAVHLNLSHTDLAQAAQRIDAKSFLVEEMVQSAVAELLLGVARDPAHGFVLTLGTGGVLTELWQDSTSLLLPVTGADVRAALTRLKTYPLLTGYRGKPAASIDAIVEATMALQACVIAHHDRIAEAEINPLMCTPTGAIAADALILIAADDKP
ncbi:acetate--CoA ligase family protein [Roseobacter sp. YSTF-M11]|uniref:Acetate--CoA ligase family protein n=1 Tax=Roseobacter insulae TaxID=2859783 RepID=A0A9X1FTA9_9RHOB|nr:acetate--CoA ligase family protein [Roseobacter insulae]MBW4707057.1 acetate--CoA ligase family protein [Roseobacter insulae]